MARVEASTVIRAPLETVYAAAKQVEDFPRFMPDVERVTVLERDGALPAVTEWVGLADGRRIHWIEEDAWDDARHVCRFRQREGDFDAYQGEWAFSEDGGGTLTRITVEFEFGVPLIGGLLSQLLRAKMQANLDGMLDALRARLEGESTPTIR